MMQIRMRLPVFEECPVCCRLDRSKRRYNRQLRRINRLVLRMLLAGQIDPMEV